jgi:hypothetical protein
MTTTAWVITVAYAVVVVLGSAYVATASAP